MTAAAGYVMENPLEVERLESKTEARASREQLELVGLGPGMRALDAGAGTGAVAREMARLVGRSGAVVGLDTSPLRAAAARAFAARDAVENLKLVAASVYDPPLADGSFDFVWSRFLFGYLADPAAALRSLVRLARPGGKVVVGEVDGHGHFHHPTPPVVAEGLEKLCAALNGRFDPFAGRKLYHLFRQAKLECVKVRVLPYHLYAGSISPAQLGNWRIKLDTLRPIGDLALGGESQYDRFARAFLDMLSDPDAFTYSTLILVEGVRGEAVHTWRNGS